MCQLTLCMLINFASYLVGCRPFLNGPMKQYFNVYPLVTEIPTQCQRFSLKQFESRSV